MWDLGCAEVLQSWRRSRFYHVAHFQFSVGRCTESITRTSNGALLDCNFRSSSWIAVKMDGPEGSEAAETFCWPAAVGTAVPAASKPPALVRSWLKRIERVHVGSQFLKWVPSSPAGAEEGELGWTTWTCGLR